MSKIIFDDDKKDSQNNTNENNDNNYNYNNENKNYDDNNYNYDNENKNNNEFDTNITSEPKIENKNEEKQKMTKIPPINIDNKITNEPIEKEMLKGQEHKDHIEEVENNI